MSAYGSGNSPFSRPSTLNNNDKQTSYNSYQNANYTSKPQKRSPSPPNPFALFSTSKHPKKLDDDQVMQETLLLQHESQHTATMVMNQLQYQRGAILNACDNTGEIKEMSLKAKLQLKEIRDKANRRKMRLYLIIFVLTIVDVGLFFRILFCGGFSCRSH